jgi:hypothetical protein
VNGHSNLTTPNTQYCTTDKSGNIIKQIVTNATKSFPDLANQEVLFNKTAFLAAAPANGWANSTGSYYVSLNGGHIIFAVNQTPRHPFSPF